MSDKEPYCEGGYRGCPTMKQIEELREALSEIREIYTGSEGIPNPETAAEAYVLRLVQEMYQTAVEALQESGDDD